MTTPDLKGLRPCPFCGSKAIDTHFVRDGRRAACGCGASVIRFNGRTSTEDAVREAWNTRAPSPELDRLTAENARLRACLQALVDLDLSYHDGEVRIPFTSHADAMRAVRTARQALEQS